MAPGVLISTVVFTLVLMGCGQQQSQTTSALAPAPGPESLKYPCDTTGGISSNPKKCVVLVKASISEGVCKVAAPEPDSAQLANSKPGRIIWKLDDPQNFRFCPTMGDGAFLKDYDVDQQFSNSHATDQPNGDHDQVPSPQCKRHYAMDDVNLPNTKDNEYRYRLQFHSKNGQTVCNLDPLIRNG